MNQKGYFYILSNKGKNILYAGSTKDLKKRVYGHKKGYHQGFTKKYNVDQLIYFEEFDQIDSAKFREKEVKGWRREKKIKLIESKNSQWVDLFDKLNRDPSALWASG